MLPYVSICTPTLNRRPFIPLIIQCINNQTYPLDRIEWVVADDGTDSIEDLVKNLKYCKYFRNEKMTLGKKRNFLHNKSRGQIIINMDDDDYYPPERISHVVDTFEKNPSCLLVGSSAMFMYSYKHEKVFKCGPYGENHCTAATMAFRRSLLDQTQCDDISCIFEEQSFLKHYSIPMIQLDPFKTILVFSHIHNSCNKDDMIENKDNTSAISDTNLTVSNFIKDEQLRNAYVADLNQNLAQYELGSLKYKPDICSHVTELKNSRNRRNIEYRKQQIIDKIQSGEIPLDVLESFLHQHSSEYMSTLLDGKNKLIDKLFEKIKELKQNNKNI